MRDNHVRVQGIFDAHMLPVASLHAEHRDCALAEGVFQGYQQDTTVLSACNYCFALALHCIAIPLAQDTEQLQL